MRSSYVASFLFFINNYIVVARHELVYVFCGIAEVDCCSGRACTHDILVENIFDK